jgi:hypothetical protein
MIEPNTDPRRRAYEFRQLVALVLQVCDVPAQARQPRPSTLHERLGEPREPSDVLGVPGWVFRTFTGQTRNLSAGLDEAKTAAEESGADHFAAVWKRPRHAAHDSYVVLTLQQFGMLVAEVKKNSSDKQD